MQPNIMKSAMKSGLILGVLFSLNFLLSLSNNTFLNILTYLIMAAAIVAIYRMTIQFRDKELGGYITYGRSFLFILLSFFYGALISSLVKFLYFQFINPEYLENLFNETMLLMENLGLADQEEIYEENLNTLLRPASFAIQYIWINMLGGVVVGLIMSAFTKKEKSIFEED